MMVATTLGGGFMFAVHAFSPFMSKAEYGLFGTLLAMIALMMIPSLTLQTTFAQQAAAAVDQAEVLQLKGSVRALLTWTTLLWIAGIIIVWLFREPLVSTLKISKPIALWVTVATALPQLWMPILLGVLQGRQNFTWLGWASILNGAGRFVAVGIIVTVLGGQAAGAITGALIGFWVGAGTALWQARSMLQGPATRIDVAAWINRIIPLTLGLGASQILFIADMLVVRSLFPEEQTGPYAAAGMMGRGVVLFTSPLAAVMFPKLVRPNPNQTGTGMARFGALGQALIGTTAFALLAAIGVSGACAFLPNFLHALEGGTLPFAFATLRIKLQPHHSVLLTLARWVPGFIWAMVPLAIGNILLNNLLARGCKSSVPWVVVVSLAYLTALCVFHSSVAVVISVMALANLVYLAVCAVWTWRMAPPNAANDRAVPI